MARALDLPTKESYLLVSFRYGDPANPMYANYTNRDIDVGPFVSTPSLEVRFGELTGDMAKNGVSIRMPLDDFTDPLTSGEEFSEVFVSVQEIIRPVSAGPGGTDLMPFFGQVTKTWRNRGGRRDDIQIDALPPKAMLDGIELGLRANHHCVFTFNKSGCLNPGLNNGPQGTIFATRTISAIDNKIVTLTTDAPTDTPKHWHRGYIQLFTYDGVRVDIRDWNDSDPRTFYMVDVPPASWAGQLVHIFAGCDKTQETCLARWNNQKNFGGPGYAIPAYNPQYENLP